MSVHATKAMLDNIEQSLIELMADFLDNDSTKLDEAIALIKDPVKRDKSELHIKMAQGAFTAYKETMLPQSPPTQLAEGSDMTAKEFFTDPKSPLTLDFLTPMEQEFLLDMIELYAKGKVNQALSAPKSECWVKIEEGLPEPGRLAWVERTKGELYIAHRINKPFVNNQDLSVDCHWNGCPAKDFGIVVFNWKANIELGSNFQDGTVLRWMYYKLPTTPTNKK